MAATMFLEINDIPCEGTEAAHIGWIVLKSMNWGVGRSVNMADLGSTQRGQGSAHFNEISCSYELSKSSPKLMLSVANGTVRGEITIHVCKSGDGTSKGMEPYLKIKMKDAEISNYNISMAEEMVPQVNFGIAYREIAIEYKTADPKTGKVGKPEEFKWDLLENASQYSGGGF